MTTGVAAFAGSLFAPEIVGASLAALLAFGGVKLLFFAAPTHIPLAAPPTPVAPSVSSRRKEIVARSDLAADVLSKLGVAERRLLGTIKKHGAGIVAKVPPRGTNGNAYGVPFTEFHRMLDRLVDIGVLEIAETGAYLPTEIGRSVVALTPEHDGPIT